MFHKCASCSEIPDAIGWSSRWKWTGSQVIECKTSWADFVRDRRKGESRMGDYRFFLCEPGVIVSDDVANYFPDHGLIYFDGRRVKYAREAPRREKPDYSNEIWFLRRAITNRKVPWEPESIVLTPNPEAAPCPLR